MKIFSSLVVYCVVLFLVLTHSCGGQSQMIGPSSPVVAMVGGDTLLPCHLEPAVDIVSLAVEWARPGLNPRFVHVRRDNVELLIDQNPSYVGRTSVSTDRLKCGDLSLKLSKVKISDIGTYRCYIPEMNTGSTVRLLVGAASSPVIRITKDASGVTLLLDCESVGWYPEPEVLWLDGEGNLLSAGPTETVRGPDDLYTVSSRVTVRHSSSFTCRVQQKDTNQTRETHLHVADKLFMAPVYLTVGLSISLVACIMSVLLSIYVWKYRPNNTIFCYEAKTEHEEEENNGPLDNNTEMNETLIRPNETVDGVNEKNINFMLTTLTSQKIDLNSQREKLESRLVDLRKQLAENKQKMEKTPAFITEKKQNKRENFTKDLEKRKTEDDELLQYTETQLQTIEEMINKMTEIKTKLEKVEQSSEINIDSNDLSLQTADFHSGDVKRPF